MADEIHEDVEYLKKLVKARLSVLSQEVSFSIGEGDFTRDEFNQ